MRKFIVMVAMLWSLFGYGKEDDFHPPPPPKLDFPMYWSAIAYNPQKGAFGYGENSMPKAAENNALKACAQASNDDNSQHCQIVVAGNHVCLALATGATPDIFATAIGYHDKQAETEQKALQQCQERSAGCSVVLYACGK